MPVAEDLGHPAGRALLDAGAEIARFREVARENRRVADRFSLAAGVVPQQAVAAVRVELAGWSIAAEEPFGRLPRLRPHPGARAARGRSGARPPARPAAALQQPRAGGGRHGARPGARERHGGRAAAGPRPFASTRRTASCRCSSRSRSTSEVSTTQTRRGPRLREALEFRSWITFELLIPGRVSMPGRLTLLATWTGRRPEGRRVATAGSASAPAAKWAIRRTTKATAR